jgi:hypothetical protein
LIFEASSKLAVALWPAARLDMAAQVDRDLGDAFDQFKQAQARIRAG